MDLLISLFVYFENKGERAGSHCFAKHWHPLFGEPRRNEIGVGDEDAALPTLFQFPDINETLPSSLNDFFSA